MHGIDQSAKIELVSIDVPVAETVGVVVSFAEPAVVHNKQLNAKLFRLRGK